MERRALHPDPDQKPGGLDDGRKVVEVKGSVGRPEVPAARRRAVVPVLGARVARRYPPPLNPPHPEKGDISTWPEKGTFQLGLDTSNAHLAHTAKAA